MEMTRKASSSADGRKYITIESRAGTAYIELAYYHKRWGARFKLASGLTAENIDWGIELMQEAKRILQNPEAEWLRIVEEQRV